MGRMIPAGYHGPCHKLIKENRMAQAKQGDTVQIHYTGKLADGTVFDTSRERHPLRFTIGNGQVIAGFEQAVVGMNTGESKTTRIPVDQAYGPRRDEMIVTMDRSQLPPGLNAQVGQRLELTQEDDSTVLVTITGVTETALTLDANHPLAGKELTFDIELIGLG
jgi:FKBP-type peptidyl-prolyl cis-trans isomerase 2